jgi:mannose-6-phosphate isomerase-like protein (cupin superfamily)
MSTRATLFLALLTGLSLSTSAWAGPPHAIYAPGEKQLVPLDIKALLKLGPDEEWVQGVSVKNISKSEQASAHIVWIRTEEKLHVHSKHDATVVVLKGKGWFRYGSQEFHVKEGDVFTVTRGIAHAFRNEAKDPTAVYVVFSPPFDGKDVIEAHDVVQ